MSFSFPSRLYPIVDALDDPRLNHVELARAVLAAGAPLVQLRVKGGATNRFVAIAREVKTIADRYGALLIINDRVDIAKLVDAAGVHVGQEDVPAAVARRILGRDKIVGFSTHNVSQADAAAREGVADYIGFGPIYTTSSKERPDPVQGIEGLRHVRCRVRLPIVAIGGITAARIADVLGAGADAVAMVGEIVRDPDVDAKVRALLAAVQQ